MASRNAEYLRRLLAAIDDFQRAFDAWMQTQAELTHVEARGLYPTVSTKADADPALVRRLELDVAETAGAASRAVDVTGSRLTVAGMGAIDPISNWGMMANPMAFISPQEIRATIGTVRGRLRAMLIEADAANESEQPGFAPSALHPVVWTGAAALWTTHQYRVAVREAAEALNAHWKSQLGRSDVDDTVFWQQTLSPNDPEPGRPRLVWPGDVTEKTTKSMRGGLEPLVKALNLLSTGLNLTVRNVTTHTRTELSEQEAMERLASYSYLARLLDACEIRRYEPGDVAQNS